MIAIIGFLSAIVLASLDRSRTKGENAAMVRQVREYVTAIQLSYAPNGNQFPGTYGLNTFGCLAVTDTSSGDRCNFNGLVLAYPSAERAMIDTYIKLKPFDTPMTGSAGNVYDSVRYASDGNTFRLRYPIKNSTDCMLDGASPFGSTVGGITVCQYESR